MNNPLHPAPKPEFKCHHGRDKQDIRCECGGQLAVGGTIHNLADFGMGFRGGKFEVKAKYSRKVAGYSGFCFKCGKEGTFILEQS